MAAYHVDRQVERQAEFAHFILEQLTQRLQQFELQVLRQASHVVMRFDHVRLAGFGARGLDDVGINRSLRQPFYCLLYTSRCV